MTGFPDMLGAPGVQAFNPKALFPCRVIPQTNRLPPRAEHFSGLADSGDR
jgi:hypothetical protein